MSMYGAKLTGDKQLIAALNRLSNKGMKDTVKRTLNRVGSILQAEARKNLRSVTSRAKSNSKTGRPMQNGVTRRAWRNNDGVTITILGDFRLKWFEKGTAERRTRRRGRYKKEKDTGRMRPSWFFKRAVDSKQRTLANDITSTLTKEISKNFYKQ